MSKIRQNLDLGQAETPIDAEPLGDLTPYVVFTQLKAKGPHLYAGWLEAADDGMAMLLAKEHYGQDQECTNIWSIDRADLASSDGLYAIENPPSGETTYRVFTQKNKGDIFLEAAEISANSAAEALEKARQAKPQAAKAHCVWVAPVDRIISSEPGEVIWRFTDQTYRLARGYTRSVKEKWKQFRDEESLNEYEKEDLKEEF
ncbi:MAG: hypothetical protein EA377_08885 [Phycisphaerales bacterium]|nr:MAG: hypothetical protein EA377_08885 [Phycisphaerales bacterium]